jgi:hypothetical protein
MLTSRMKAIQRIKASSWYPSSTLLTGFRAVRACELDQFFNWEANFTLCKIPGRLDIT